MVSAAPIRSSIVTKQMPADDAAAQQRDAIIIIEISTEKLFKYYVKEKIKNYHGSKE